MSDKISKEVRERFERLDPISSAELSEMRLNSYERAYLLPRLSVEALAQSVRYTLNNCERVQSRFPTTYDDHLKAHLVPELLRRIETK
jgi:type VI protein secretion system component VasK